MEKTFENILVFYSHLTIDAEFCIESLTGLKVMCVKVSSFEHDPV